jgi:hypothetical protein
MPMYVCRVPYWSAQGCLPSLHTLGNRKSHSLTVHVLGWIAVYRLFLVKIPIVQEMMGLREMQKPGAGARR